MNAPIETWLRCNISPGMFDNEVGVDGRQANGSVFSLFAPADTVDDGGQQLTTEASIPGWVRVEEISRKDNLVLVELPRQTFQNGAFITVQADQLQKRPQCQKV